MPVEINKARRARTPAQELESVFLRDGLGARIPALDVRVKEGELQAKLFDEGHVGWYALQASDELTLGADAAVDDLAGEDAKRPTNGASSLLREIMLLCADGTTLRVKGITRAKQRIRLTVTDDNSDKAFSRLLLAGETLCLKPEIQKTAAPVSLGDAIRLKITESLAATASAPSATKSVPAVAYRAGGVQGGFQDWKKMPANIASEPRKRSFGRAITIYSTSVASIVVSGLFLYHQYCYYDPNASLYAVQNGQTISPMMKFEEGLGHQPGQMAIGPSAVEGVTTGAAFQGQVTSDAP